MRKILMVGSGAREHALARALVDEGHRVVSAPGNAGTALLGPNAPVAIDDIDGLVALALREKVDLVVVGPELPLTLGLVDALADKAVRTFGPTRAAAQLEGSKAFMKRFLVRHGIPTAACEIFDDADRADAYIRAANRPLVVKADGLAAGKGVVVAATTEEACAAVQSMMRERAFGDAGKTVIVEELLPGEEASFHVVCVGGRAIALAPAQDHKRIFDGDRGPNTGGMGAYAPAPIVTAAVHAIVMRTIVAPTLEGMARENTPFEGVLFVGLMIENGVPRVLEFNVRFGDPETTVLVPLYGGSWFDLLSGAPGDDPAMRPGAALAVVMAAEGYPAKPRTGDAIAGLEHPLAEGLRVHHAGTKLDDEGHVVTAGGRVLTVAAYAATLADAASGAYQAVNRIQFRGAQHRRDIGHRAMR
jgi:phosphoribosylamine--glycine ligase